MTTPDNPYRPPKAELRDTERVRLLAERPRQIIHATLLLWISFILGVLSAYSQSKAQAESTAAMVVQAVIVLVVAVVMSVSVWRGRNWARVLYLALVLLSFTTLPLSLADAARPAVEKGLEAVSYVADAGSLFLLFTKPGSLWFRYVRDSGQSV